VSSKKGLIKIIGVYLGDSFEKEEEKGKNY